MKKFQIHGFGSVCLMGYHENDQKIIDFREITRMRYIFMKIMQNPRTFEDFEKTWIFHENLRNLRNLFFRLSSSNSAASGGGGGHTPTQRQPHGSPRGEQFSLCWVGVCPPITIRYVIKTGVSRSVSAPK